QQRNSGSIGHARKATNAPCDQTDPTSRGRALPVPTEKPRKVLGYMRLLVYRPSVLACSPPALAQVPILVLKSKSKTRSIPMWDALTSRGRECTSILQVQHDWENVHRHAPKRSRNSNVRPPRQQRYRAAQEQLHPWVSTQNESACEPGRAANYSPDWQMPQGSGPKIFPAHRTPPPGDVIDKWQLYEDTRSRIE